MRLLLLYRKGICSFQELRTVHNIIYSTFKAALEPLGLSNNDNEWNLTLLEASHTATPKQLRELFVQILIHCLPNKPEDLWEKYKDFLSEDILHQFQQYGQTLEFNENIYKISLSHIDLILRKFNSDLSKYPTLPQNIIPLEVVNALSNCELIAREIAYDPVQLQNEHDHNLPLLNFDQKLTYDAIISQHKNKKKG